MFRHHPIRSIDFNHHQSATSEEFSLVDASYYMFYSLHVVEPLRYDSVLIKETNE